ncbi:MAG: hypothetical protein NVSMB18_02760 [Acetobacteraceae bacterium]
MSIVACLAGCAAPPPPPVIEPPVAVAPAPAAPGGFDGVYRGSGVITHSTARHCPVPGAGRTVVRDGVVRRRWNNMAIEAPVQPDGTFNTQLGRVRMGGRIAGGRMEFDLGSEFCQYHFALARAGR